MLAVIDYGGGNLGSLLASLRRREVDAQLVSTPEALDAADAAMLPGDGAFGATLQALRERGLLDALMRFLKSGKPFFGICVGMQILYERSTEHGDFSGLGIFPGLVERFTAAAPRIPHMGWNALNIVQDHPIVQGIATGEYVYFLHSFRVAPGPSTVATAMHGESFTAIVAQGNIVATQFHPEKSQQTGAKILDNFLRMIPV